MNNCEDETITAAEAARTVSNPSIDIEQGNFSLGEVGFLSIVNAAENSIPPLSAACRIQLYHNWLSAGGSRSGDAFGAWFNMGVIYSQHLDYSSAILAYRQSLTVKPGFHAAAINLGLALEASGDSEAAMRVWSNALQPDAERTSLLNQQGRLLEQRGKLEEAHALLCRSLMVDATQSDVIQHIVHLRQKMCSWPILNGSQFALTDDELLAYSGPLGVLAMTDDVQIQRRVTASWIERKTHACSERLAPPTGYTHSRIRIGYLSSDFCSHAMSYLVAELFEQHDRNQFEVFAYCASREDGSAIRQRVLAAFDHCRHIGPLDNEQAARLIRADEIDILIDLNGLTAGGRPQILRWKPAPCQLTYLGFVGPVPIPELDGILCDGFVIPAEQTKAYLPQPVPVSWVYQANDNNRNVFVGLTRAIAGLPSDCFVFCCFCGHFKITEQMFGAWMSILRQTPGSILWLPEDNAWSRNSMRENAIKLNIDPDRLHFAARCAPDLYMARLGLADLFLDTFPYNAGTVASDAIRMHLPIVTLPGRSFASRMAAGLLTAYGVTDGVAVDLDDYVDKAVSYANQPSLHAGYRQHFSQERWSATLGNVSGFTRAYEGSLISFKASQEYVLPEPLQNPRV